MAVSEAEFGSILHRLRLARRMELGCRYSVHVVKHQGNCCMLIIFTVMPLHHRVARNVQPKSGCWGQGNRDYWSEFDAARPGGDSWARGGSVGANSRRASAGVHIDAHDVIESVAVFANARVSILWGDPVGQGGGGGRAVRIRAQVAPALDNDFTSATDSHWC